MIQDDTSGITDTEKKKRGDISNILDHVHGISTMVPVFEMLNGLKRSLVSKIFVILECTLIREVSDKQLLFVSI